MTLGPSAAPFDRRRHIVREFSCGKPALDQWLKRHAGQGQRRDTTRTFVRAGEDGTVVGYYTLVVTELRHADATPEVAAGTSPRFPIPACLIARLAVDRTVQGQRLGSWLLRDALRRVLAAAEQVAIRAVMVDAIDDDAARFYEQRGFQRLPGAPRRLMISLSAVRTIIDADAS